VDDVSLRLAPGEIFALLGPNGAGKTTTLRMLAGLLSPSSGSVHLGEEMMSPSSAPRLRARIGFLTESPGLWDRLSVRQNLAVYARLQGLPRPDTVVNDVLDAFDIRDRARDPTALLSKGLKQRVALARTLLHRPDVVLLDEPTSGLDPESARDVRSLILRLRDERRAILLSTHNLDEVERVADRVAVMRSRLVAVDTPAALRARLFGARLRVVLGQPGDAFSDSVKGPGVSDVRTHANTLSIAVDDHAVRAPAVVRRLVAAGADILTVVPEEPSLEQVYIRLLGDEDA
jgi:ABC-2 type transport system ATP-binding protein